MKAFVAIEFEDETKEYLSALQQNVKTYCKSGNYTKKENFHLTLRFIGEVKREEIDALSEAVCEAANRSKSFSMNLYDIDFFQNGEKNIVWAGLGKNKNLARLYQTLEKCLEKQGFSREKRGLSPHITLGREVVLFSSRDKIKSMATVEQREIVVNKLSLMESARAGGQLIYKPIYVKLMK